MIQCVVFVRGGITDKLLGDYANLFGDLSANSGNNAMSHDASFTADFLQRHQHKLVFGSDCACADNCIGLKALQEDDRGRWLSARECEYTGSWC